MKVQKSPLPHFNDRPEDTIVDTIIIHSIYAASSPEPLSAQACTVLLDQHQVAAHYLIDRAGLIYQLVAEEKRAWHAGVSKLPYQNDSRENVNDFSIGIELVGKPEELFSESQYTSLAQLCKQIILRHKIKYILGHDQIAPGRKVDPGVGFDWGKFRGLLGERDLVFAAATKNIK